MTQTSFCEVIFIKYFSIFSSRSFAFTLAFSYQSTLGHKSLKLQPEHKGISFHTFLEYFFRRPKTLFHLSFGSQLWTWIDAFPTVFHFAQPSLFAIRRTPSSTGTPVGSSNKYFCIILALKEFMPLIFTNSYKFLGIFPSYLSTNRVENTLMLLAFLLLKVHELNQRTKLI